MTISYELALKMKEKGFPLYQSADLGTNPKEGESTIVGHMKVGGVFLKLPTLSELIEACGNKFFSLTLAFSDEWEARPYYKGKVFKGSTPKIAVANLWLALQDNR